MVVSMHASSRCRDSVRSDADQHAEDRYEHYLAEHEPEDIDRAGDVRDPGVITPLADDKVARNVAMPEQDDNTPTGSTTSVDVSNGHDKYEGEQSAATRSTWRNNGGGEQNHGSLSLDGFLTMHQLRSSPTTRRGLTPLAGSTQSSSGSLHALSEHEELSMQAPVRRAVSTKSNPGRGRVRSTSTSKITSFSQPNSKRPSQSESFVYPDQSFPSLQTSNVSGRPQPVLRTRSSHPAQHSLYTDMAKVNRITPTSGVRTADNTPMSSPGLFTPSQVRHNNLVEPRSSSPQLHHLQAPKETHTAAIEHDVFSGNKFINNYEIVKELGRGEHGKVKLGRDIKEDTLVAIKIVPRYSAKRRFRELGAPEDRTKREVAILKKARHPNVVSLLEVIDDPNKNKVYLILECVDKGEIKWRKHGVREILTINNQRFELEKNGISLNTEPSDRDVHIVHQAQMRHERLEQMRRHHQGLSHIPNWSLEYAGETDDENEMMDISRTLSRLSGPSRSHSQDDYMSDPPLSSSIHSLYLADFNRNRKFSIAASAASHMSSEMNFDRDDDQRSYVPALTMEEARRSFQDTLLGLEFLHFIGIIHRDIKPANLLVSSNAQVKISDFGVSYLGRPISDEEIDHKMQEEDTTPLDTEKELARSVGTPAFWAPELCYEDVSMFTDGREPRITGALDLWALGITLYCMIYARLPFYHDEHMGLHEAVCTTEVFCPKTRLMAVDTTSSDPVSRISHSIAKNKRADYELKFEYVPETLRDLIGKLLVKDPVKRITIAEAKRHPWVTEGISNPETFFQNREIGTESKKKILDINEKEMDHAVVKRTMLERALTTAGRIAGNLLGRKDNRKRASTTASSAGSSSESLYSPVASNASTVGKTDKARDPRRASLRGDELLQALKASREPGEHPLAQSQTASPDSREPTSPGYFDRNMKAASTGATPGIDFDRQSRPRAPDRAVSALSTAESVKTIRASHHQRPPMSDPNMNVDLSPNEASLRSRVEGLWEGTTKTIHRLASRDRRAASSRSRSQSRPSSENDGHANPSLAVSNAYAAGAIQTPNALRAVDSKLEHTQSNRSAAQFEHTRQSPFRVPSSDHIAFEHAQHINYRRQIQEAQAKSEADTAASELGSGAGICPPSPDDLTFLEQSAPQSAQMSPFGMGSASIPTAVSASTIASSVDGYENSSVSQSISNPSIGAISGSSSPPGDNFLTSDYKHEPTVYSSETEPEFMRTADTVVLHGRPTAPTATGKPLQAEHEYYQNDDEDVESDYSDEDGIVMGGPQRN